MIEIRDAEIAIQKERMENYQEQVRSLSKHLIDKDLMRNTLETILDFKFDDVTGDSETIKKLITTVLKVIDHER